MKLKNFLSYFLFFALLICVGVIVYNNTKSKDVIHITDTSKVVTIVKNENGDYSDDMDKEDFDKEQEIEPIYLNLLPDNEVSCNINYYSNNDYSIEFGGYLDSKLSGGDTLSMTGNIYNGANKVLLWSLKDFKPTEQYLNDMFRYIYTSNENGLFRLSFKNGFVSALYDITCSINPFALKTNYKTDTLYSIWFDLSSICNLEIFDKELNNFVEVLNAPIIKISFVKNTKKLSYGLLDSKFKKFDTIPNSTLPKE